MEVKICCPACMDSDATVTVDLRTGQNFVCSDCNAEFTLENIQDVIQSWSKILPWLNSHPAVKSAKS